MYCFTSYDGYDEELETMFGSESQMRELYKKFIKDMDKDDVLRYYNDHGWDEKTFEDILNSQHFSFTDYNGYVYTADWFKVRRTHGRWPALKLTISRWRTAAIRKLISFLKKYE